MQQNQPKLPRPTYGGEWTPIYSDPDLSEDWKKKAGQLPLRKNALYLSERAHEVGHALGRRHCRSNRA